MRSVNAAFRDICLALPLLLLAGLPARAFEIAHPQLTPPDLLSTASVLSTGHAESRPLPARRRLELALVDHFGLLKPRTAERIRLEVEEIFASLDTDIGWVDPLSDPPVEAVGTRVRVILMPAPPKAWGGSGTMGVVHKSEGLVESVYIFPPAVMRTMRLKPNRLQHWAALSATKSFTQSRPTTPMPPTGSCGRNRTPTRSVARNWEWTHSAPRSS